MAFRLGIALAPPQGGWLSEAISNTDSRHCKSSATQCRAASARTAPLLANFDPLRPQPNLYVSQSTARVARARRTLPCTLAVVVTT
jgi:hypothetical protein